jgi:antitoxin (DNA-binding transcriptional repressor) of toxin-antitoxin stability system
LSQESSKGKEVVIARGDEPVAKLVAIGADRKKRVPGKFAGQISYAPDAFDPLTDRELADLGFK